MGALKALFLSCLLLLPVSCNGQSDQEQYAEYVRSVHWESTHHKDKMDVERSIELVEVADGWADYFKLDRDRHRAKINWESGFVNKIRDRNLKFESWSYGYSGIQVETAQRSADRLGLGIKITGRELILNYDLNIMLGAEHMRFLLDERTKGDQRIAEMSYNAGYNGYLKGRGKTYPACIDAMIKQWLKFKAEKFK